MFGKTAKRQGANGQTALPLSIIGSDVRIVGDIITQGEMQIDGQIDGDISCARLVVGESACITGAIKAEIVRIHGQVNGTIVADSVKIAKTAVVVGDVTHDTMEMEAGGHVEGHLIRKGAQPPTMALEAPRQALTAPEAETEAETPDEKEPAAAVQAAQ